MTTRHDQHPPLMQHPLHPPGSGLPPPRRTTRRRAGSFSVSLPSSTTTSTSSSPSPSPPINNHHRSRPRPLSAFYALNNRSLGNLGHGLLETRSPTFPTSPRAPGMADARTPQSRVSQPRRKVSSVDRDRDGPVTSFGSGPRLKARVNVAEIVNPGSVQTTSQRPGLNRAPSSLSAGGRSDSTQTYGRPRSPHSTSSRSSVGIGPATPTSSSIPQVIKAKPLVAKAQASRTPGTPASVAVASAPASVVATPTYRRSASVIGVPTGGELGGGVNAGPGAAAGVATGSSATTPSRSPPQRRSPTSSTVGAAPSRPTSAAMASMGSRFKSALASNNTENSSPSAQPSPSHIPTPTHVTPSAAVSTRVHVRGPPSAKVSVSSSGSRSPLISPALTASPHLDDADPRTVSSPRSVSVPERHNQQSASTGHSPLSSIILGHSSLAEVTPAWANETMHAPGFSSSLLSPSTLIPSVFPPTPPQLGFEGDPSQHAAFAPFGTATLTTDFDHHVSSNHSSPVRPPLPLDGPSPLRAQFPHLSLPPHPTSSCPTSPTPNDRVLASNVTTRRGSRQALPFHPHSLPLGLSPAPDSPELRTVALPLMTPTRSPDSADDFQSHPHDVPLVARVRGMANGSRMIGGIRRYSSSSNSSDDYGTSPHSGLSVHADRDRLSGSTIADDSDEAGDAPKLDDLEAVFSDEEKAKVERKIADLEISNASLMAINRTLEATKAKQRTEIVKLRRMLRESQSGLARPVAEVSVPGPLPSLARVMSTDDEGGGWGDDEMDDPELEARWDRLASLVDAMRKRGEDAVERGKEETKPAQQRVLGWLEVEALADDSGQMVSRATSEAGDGEEQQAVFRTRDRDDEYNTDYTEHTDVTHSTNLSAASNATQLAGEVLERGQRF